MFNTADAIRKYLILIFIFNKYIIYSSAISEFVQHVLW